MICDTYIVTDWMKSKMNLVLKENLFSLENLYNIHNKSLYNYA